MTVKQFREHKYLCSAWSKELRTNAILQRVLEVMEENHPARFTLTPDNGGDISPTRANIELGLTRGYSKYGDTLRLMGNPLQKAADIGPTEYLPPPVPELQQR